MVVLVAVLTALRDTQGRISAFPGFASLTGDMLESMWPNIMYFSREV